jgi:hypothetical protein
MTFEYGGAVRSPTDPEAVIEVGIRVRRDRRAVGWPGWARTQLAPTYFQIRVSTWREEFVRNQASTISTISMCLCSGLFTSFSGARYCGCYAAE